MQFLIRISYRYWYFMSSESLRRVQDFARSQQKKEAQRTTGFMLSGKRIIELGLVQGILNSRQQVQPAGVDFTLKQLATLESIGTIDFDNTKRVLPKYQPLQFEDGMITLKPGAYLVEFNETVLLPNDVIGIMRTRSSIFRSGATLTAGVIDPGYSGAIGALLQVWNNKGITIEKNARLAQWVFAKVGDPSGKGYAGVYKGAKNMF